MFKDLTVTEVCSRIEQLSVIYPTIPKESPYKLEWVGNEPNTKATSPAMVDVYNIVHVETGYWLRWKGASVINYGVWLKEFDTFFNYTHKGRKKWKQARTKAAKEEKNKMCTPTMIKEVPGQFQKKKETPSSWMIQEMDDGIYDYEAGCNCVNCDYYETNYIKGNNKMYATSNTAIVATPQPESIDQRDYLWSRLNTISWEKQNDLRKHFKTDPVPTPETFRELIKKIKEDDFTIDEKMLDKKYPLDRLYDIRWTKDPADQAGYEAAFEKMTTAKTKTQDKIKILSPEEGLKALEAFEAETFH